MVDPPQWTDVNKGLGSAAFLDAASVVTQSIESTVSNIKIAVVNELPGTPDPSTLYCVTYNNPWLLSLISGVNLLIINLVKISANISQLYIQ